MICLIKEGVIVFGPAPWNFNAVLEHLIIAGFDLMDGTLYGPDKAAVCAFPDTEPDAPLTLPSFKVLPAMAVNDPTPEDKMLAGREPVVLEDRVELRPVWADLPPPPPLPSLEEEKAAATEEVRIASERVRVKYYPTGKELDIRRGAPGYTQEHLDVLNSFLDGTLNTVANQAATEIENAPDLTTLRDILSGYRALYAQELA